MPEYKRPGWFTAHAGNPLINLAARLGLSLGGANELTVRGRTTGRALSTPVNPLEVDGQRYLVAPRGETHWVRNLRASGEGELRLGRRREKIRVAEVPDVEKPPILEAYLARWGNLTRTHFGASEHPDAAELERLASRSPVFRIIEAVPPARGR